MTRAAEKIVSCISSMVAAGGIRDLTVEEIVVDYGGRSNMFFGRVWSKKGAEIIADLREKGIQAFYDDLKIEAWCPKKRTVTSICKKGLRLTAVSDFRANNP